jgi:riboflavin kinase/FMN adenylyltransferase
MAPKGLRQRLVTDGRPEVILPCPFQPHVAILPTPINNTVISGLVRRGRQIGRQLGFPTANVQLPEDQPTRFGVYATRSRVADGRLIRGVASIGINPTLPKPSPIVEVWLFDFDEQIYDQPLSTELVAFIRNERWFEDIAALQKQVFRDGEEARRILFAMG